VCWLE
jgi:hypothetical protein